jgi:predicted ATPase
VAEGDGLHLLAGDRAAHAFANTEARDHYARALEAGDKVMPPPSLA